MWSNTNIVQLVSLTSATITSSYAWMVSDWKGESFSFMAHVESGKNRLANHFFDLRHRQTWLLSSEDWQWRGQRLLRLVSLTSATITSSYA
jgi:hypothetical protein